MFNNLTTPKKFEGNEQLNQFALTKNISEVSNNFFNIIAGLTKCIVTYLNHSENYDFQSLISMLLSDGFIQIHLHKTPNSSNEIKNITFEIKNTKHNDYRIRLDYGTNYQADRCQGKIKFKIK